MKIHSMLGLGLASSLVCGSVATADLQELDYRIVANNAVAGDNNWTVEIYAVLDDGSRLDAVAGDGKLDKRVAISGGSFYQNAFGGNTSVAINPLLIPTFPELEYDSWVTIGAMDSTGAPYLANALLDIGIDWTAFEAGGDIYTDNGTWFITPDDDQGEHMVFTNQNCEDRNGVLVARLTVFDPNGVASVFLGALFQGKDATGATWQQSATIEFTYPTITDCNNNGVDDGCDIINGTSNDDNANGVPDECEFTDCNNNGVADEDDIANGTSDDCNLSGVPDECELVGGDCNDNGILDECENFDDCNDNGIPDECETFSDCNDNGIPDECEDLQDWDDNGVPDACEGLVAYNATSGAGYGSLELALSDASGGDIVWVDGTYADTLTDIDFHGAAVDVLILGGGSPTAAVQMAAGSSLHVGSSSALAGINSDTSGTASVSSDMHLHSSSVNVYRDSSLNLAGGHMILGDINQRMGSELSLDAPTTNVDGLWTCSTGSAIYASSGVSLNGSMVGTFDLFGSMSNSGTLNATNDVLISSDLTNNGLIAIHRGVLYVFGNVTNNGTILGEVDSGPGIRGGGEEPAPGDGMKVIGDYTLGENASLLMPHPNWQIAVGGDFDSAINDSAMFVMNQATLKFNGHDGEQLVEVMSGDYGPTEDALNPGFGCTYPLGTFVVSSGSHVVLTDGHNNDCDGMLAEVIYAENLYVAPGATLDTNGYIIYVSEVDNQGTIIGEDDIIIINPPLPGDANGDGLVGILDVLVVIADWGPCDGCAGDQNGDGQASILDILFIIANWS